MMMNWCYLFFAICSSIHQWFQYFQFYLPIQFGCEIVLEELLHWFECLAYQFVVLPCRYHCAIQRIRIAHQFVAGHSICFDHSFGQLIQVGNQFLDVLINHYPFHWSYLFVDQAFHFVLDLLN
eukprot:NODE_1400_length_1142_cov_0.077661.p2 type:complete len:123 gc:universal NODE_1400_length_1142_cov_0.077661:56-424(+)